MLHGGENFYSFLYESYHSAVKQTIMPDLRLPSAQLLELGMVLVFIIERHVPFF